MFTMVRDDPFVRQFVSKLPEPVAESLSDEQLLALKELLGPREARGHVIDWRWRLSFWRWQYYFVVLAGRNRREPSRRERELQRLAVAALILGFIAFSTLLGLLVLYLVKSAMGINLFQGFSLGIWDWFRWKFL